MNDAKPMTLEELTNWIWNTPQKTHDQIYEAIQQACDEARAEERELNRREIEVAHKIVEGVEDVNNHILDVAKEAYEKGYHQGFADAKEKAAKVCENWPGPGGIVRCEELTDQGILLGHRQGFARAIRALESDK